MLHVAVSSMLAHDALRKRNTQQFSEVCVGHARLSSDRIATAMVVRPVTIKNTTTLENASSSIKTPRPCSRGSVLHAQLRLVVARSALSAKGNAKTWRALEWTMVSVANAKTNVEGLAIVMGEERAQNTTVSSRRKELALTVQCRGKLAMHV